MDTEYPNVHVSTHPVLLHKLTQLRRQETSPKHFREILREVTNYLGYEATANLETTDLVVQTPVASHTGVGLKTRVSLIPVMRAGLGMVDSMLDILPSAKVHHIGMFHNKAALCPVCYYNKLPAKPDCDIAMILEPLIATARTVNAVIEIIKEWGAAKVVVIAVVCSKAGLDALYKAHPNVTVFTCAIDELDSSDRILPGLGDASDRQFNDAESLRARFSPVPDAKRQRN